MAGIHIAGKKTMADRCHLIEEHVHNESAVYPTLAAGVTVTGHADAWTLGAYAEIVPASTITGVFDIHFINVEDASADDIYELVLYEVTTEIARVRFVVDTSVFGGGLPSIPIITPIIAANAQIQAKLATSAGGSDTAVVSVHYHTY
jgi:hypothetical protein